jgi:hypothetical protein
LISLISTKNVERSLTKGLSMSHIRCRIEVSTTFLAWTLQWLRLTRLAHEQWSTIWLRSSGTSNTAVSAFALAIVRIFLRRSRRDRRDENSAMANWVEIKQTARSIKYKKDKVTTTKHITARFQ